MENNEIFETEVDFVEAEVVDENEGINPMIIGAGAALAGVALVGGGIAAVKKFGGKAKAKLDEAREAHIVKKQAKLDAKYIKIQERKEAVVPEKESEEE